MKLTWLSRLTGAACIGAVMPCLVSAQSSAAGAPAPVAIEVEDDVEVVASPEQGKSTPAATPAAPAAAGVVAPPVTAAPASPPVTDVPATPRTITAPGASEAAERIASLEARLAALEAAQTAAKVPAQTDAPVKPDPVSGNDFSLVDPWLGVAWSAFVQSEYEHNQFSEDQLQPDGQPRNSDRFLVRRARLRMQRNWQYAGMDIEFDANTARGMQLGMRRLSGAVYWPAPDPHAVPYLRGNVGLIDIPFGQDLAAGARGRIFGERSTASLAFFPFEADVGAAIDGGYGPLRYAVAIMNGPEAGADFRIRDPNAAKDLLLRVGIDTAPHNDVHITGGVSFLEGTGFHPGTAPTKNTLQWNDVNEDGLKTDAEVSGVPGSAAQPSRNFDRWGLALDGNVRVRSTLGWSWLSAEMYLAQNLDRGLFVADPIASSLASRELGYYIGLTQEITRWFVVGFRTDFYDGNSDFIERRRGQAFRQPQTVRTYSPLIGVVLPGLARLTFQYDFVRDTLGRDLRGEPADLKNDQWTVRLQVGL